MFATTSLSCIAKLLSCTMLYYPHGNGNNNRNTRTECNNKSKANINYAQELSNDWKTILVFNKEMSNEPCGLHFTEDATNDKAVQQAQLLERNKRYNHNKEGQGTEQPMSLYTSRFYLDKVDEELLASCEPLSAIFANSKTPHHRTVYLDSVNGSLPLNWFELGKAMFSSTNLIIHLSVQERARNALIDCSTNTSVNVGKDSCVAGEAKAVPVVADATVTSPEVKVKRKETRRKLLMQSNKSQLKKNRKRVIDKNNKSTTNILEEAVSTTTIKKERRGRPRKVKAIQSSSLDQEHRLHKSAHKLQNKITTSSQGVHLDEIERIVNQIKAERHGNNINKKRKAVTRSITAAAAYHHGDFEKAANKEDNKQQEQVSNSNKKEDEKTGVLSETDTKLKRKLIRKQIKLLMKELKEEHQKQKQQEYQAQQSIPLPNVLIDKPTRQLRKKKIEAMMIDHTSASITSSTHDNKSSIIHSDQSNSSTINSKSNITESDKDVVQVVHDAIKQYGENYNAKNENCTSSSFDKMYNTTLTHNTDNLEKQEQEVNTQKRKRGRPRKYVTLPLQQQQTQNSINLPVEQHDTTIGTPLTSFTENEIHNNEITF